MARKSGSGMAHRTTAAIEYMVAAILRGDPKEAREQAQVIDIDASRGRVTNGLSGSDVLDLLGSALPQLGLDITDALANPPDLLGDVRATGQDGRSTWFEVKGQVTKARFADITQADWVRDSTDFIRCLLLEREDVRVRIEPAIRAELGLDLPPDYFSGWPAKDLWLADVALLTDRARRLAARVKVPEDLHGFMARKFLVHVTKEGVRIARLDKLRPVEAIKRSPLAWAPNFTNASAVSIAIAVPGPPGHGQTDFTYHVGYSPGVLGRHKLHARAVAEASDLIVVRT